MDSEEKIEAFRHGLCQIPMFADYRALCVNQTGSTNDDLKADWSGKNFTKKILTADFQTSGHGQYKRKWVGKSGQALMFSFSLRGLDSQFPLTLMTGTALFEAVRHYAAPEAVKDLWLKWPNDIWFKNGKLAGILCESTFVGSEQRIVIGIGMNFLPLSEASVNSSSLSELCALPDRFDFLLEFFRQFAKLSTKSPQEMHALWYQCAGSFWQREFRFTLPDGSSFTGFPAGITADGKLTAVDTASKEQHTLASATLLPL